MHFFLEVLSSKGRRCRVHLSMCPFINGYTGVFPCFKTHLKASFVCLLRSQMTSSFSLSGPPPLCRYYPHVRKGEGQQHELRFFLPLLCSLIINVPLPSLHLPIVNDCNPLGDLCLQHCYPSRCRRHPKRLTKILEKYLTTQKQKIIKAHDDEFAHENVYQGEMRHQMQDTASSTRCDATEFTLCDAPSMT